MQHLLRILAFSVLVVFASVSVSVPAWAQAQVDENGAPLYEAWETLANRAQEVLDANRASTDALTDLREQLTSWREVFQRRQGVNADRIETLRSQISALGPLPEEGEVESDEIVERRQLLQEDLEAATAPVRQAEEAFARADGLVAQLDSIVRDRQTNQILELNPTPLNPALWDDAAFSVADLWTRLVSEIRTSYVSPLGAENLRNNLPLILLLVVFGLTLLVRGGSWVEKGLALLRSGNKGAKARFRLGLFVLSLASFALPVIGMIAILTAADQSGLLGRVSDAVMVAAFLFIVTIFVARWLGRQVAPPAEPPKPILTLSDRQGVQLRLLANLAGLLVGTNLAINYLLEQRFISETASSVVGFPIIVLAGLAIFRLGQLLVASSKAAAEARREAGLEVTGDAPSGLIVRYLGRALRLVAIGGPVLAAIGYTFAGNALVFSSFLTLGLLAALAILQRLVRDLYAAIRGNEESMDGLVPVIVGFALALCALPILALIWGARGTDLTEAWGVISEGVPLGEARISPVDFLTFAIVFVLGYGLTRLLQGTLKTQVLPKTKMDTGGRNAVVAGTGYVGIFLAAVIAITSAGIDLSNLAIVAGALSVGIGFGLQTIVSNFVSGIILLIERPISEGDWIEVGNTMGVVKGISVRSTLIETFDRTDVIVPNADLIAGTVTNWTRTNLTGRLILPVGVAYGSDTRRVEELLKEIAQAHPMVILTPPPSVVFQGFGADSMDFEIRAILRDVNFTLSVKTEMNHQIAERFVAEGIEIPFAQRDIWIKNPEALGQGGSS